MTTPTPAPPNSRPTPGKLTASDVAFVAEQAGFKGPELVAAVAVSFAENASHDPGAIHHNSNGTIDVGLWQINSVHGYSTADMQIPQKNAQAAYAISHSGNDWSPWATWNSGKASAQPNVKDAEIAVSNAGYSTGNWATWVDQHVPGVHQAADVAQGAFGWTHYVGQFFSNVTSGAFWRRIGIGFAGVLLVLFALYVAFHKSAASATSKIPKVIPV